MSGSVQSTGCSLFTYTAATYEMTAGGYLQADDPRRSSCDNSHSTRSNDQTRIRRPSMHNVMDHGRCLGRSW